MIITQDIQTLRQHIQQWRKAGDSIAFVPTMGNLHEGHLSLVDKAQAAANRTVASIFVNPLQFGPGEDFESYPRTEAEDESKLIHKNIDLLFKPKVKDIICGTSNTLVKASPLLANILCGKSRPGHFDGVTTIVAKLFNLVQPDIAVFGQKDYQQALIIKQMVTDLNYPLEIITAPICREKDGLAMSSRNQYLSKSERVMAPKLYQTLLDMQENTKEPLTISQLEIKRKEKLEDYGFMVDYLTIRNKNTLELPTEPTDECIILAAVYLGKTRLIDNVSQKP